MAKASAKKKGTQYKPFRMVRLPKELADSLEKIGKKKYSTMTEQAKQAVLEFLAKNASLLADSKQ